MRTQEEILNNPRITPALITEDGCKGTISVGGWLGSVIWSTCAGWDHVSVAPFKHKITPSWDDMCKVKEIFFRDDEAVIQIHPPKDQAVNNLENCLHLWRCTRTEMVLPPSVLVGLRKGQTMAESTDMQTSLSIGRNKNMNLSSAKYGLSSLSEKLKNNTIPENPNSYICSLDIAIECIELIQHLQSSGCDHCRLRILDGGYRCLLLPHPEDFIEECGVNIAYKNCPLRIHKELNNE